MHMDLELKRRLGSIDQSQQRIERQLGAIIRALATVVKMDVRLLNEERQDAMAIKDVISQLQADVKDNKDATNAVQTALEGYAKANADLTQQLKDALANGLDNADEDALKQIAADLEANNNALHQAAPATAKAVVENTPAAS